MDEREAYLINARTSRRHMEELPRFTFDSSLDLIQAVEGCQSIADMGIGTLAFISRYGTCSLHGEVTDEVEVSHGIALAEDKIRCWLCHEQFGITKKCPVEGVSAERS